MLMNIMLWSNSVVMQVTLDVVYLLIIAPEFILTARPTAVSANGVMIEL